MKRGSVSGVISRPEWQVALQPVVITGGCGFVGTNLAHRLMEMGQRVLVYDNLSRPGVERNLEWLAGTHPDLLEVEIGDVRESRPLGRAIGHASHVFHFAAQVAVTTSLADPLDDFEVNARGTLNVLEAIRKAASRPPLLFTSTNKVYGDLAEVELEQGESRYRPLDATTREHGISEERLLSFHSPYGCSKGAADQYVIDYARSYSMPATVFRMSCIYGPHQYGNEDQGWVAHFVLRALNGESIVLFGDGRQIRDLLFVDDLIDAMLRIRLHLSQLAGRAFNIGGGTQNTSSLVELIAMIEEKIGRRVVVEYDEWRAGDQRYYVSDTRRFREVTAWEPQVGLGRGVELLIDWLEAHAVGDPARKERSASRPGSAPATAVVGEARLR
jgi:CDP-paratose 2-epimerase